MNFVLVHGAWLGAWCWEAVAKELIQLGHNVAVPELPGHGNDQTLLAKISLNAYVDTVSQAIRQWNTPVILVGHSMAGLVIRQTAEIMPERISRLIYVAAYLLRDGENIIKLSEQAPDSLVGPNMILAPDYRTVSLRQEKLRDIFCADASAETAQQLADKFRPEPAEPFSTALAISAGRGAYVPRAFITTTNDRAVTPKLQNVMLKNTPCDPILRIQSSHTPFFSRPKELANLLLQATGQIESDDEKGATKCALR